MKAVSREREMSLGEVYCLKQPERTSFSKLGPNTEIPGERRNDGVKAVIEFKKKLSVHDHQC